MIGFRRYVRGFAEQGDKRVDGITAHVQNRGVAQRGVKGVDMRLSCADAVVAGGILRELRCDAAKRPDLGQRVPDDGQRVVKHQPHGLQIDHVIGVCRLDERLRLLSGQNARLFQQHVLAVPQQAHGLVKVAEVRACDIRRVERVRGRKRLQIGEHRVKMVFFREFPAGFFVSGINRRRAQLRHLLHRRQHPVDDKIPSDDPHANGHAVSLHKCASVRQAGRMRYFYRSSLPPSCSSRSLMSHSFCDRST